MLVAVLVSQLKILNTTFSKTILHVKCATCKMYYVQSALHVYMLLIITRKNKTCTDKSFIFQHKV